MNTLPRSQVVLGCNNSIKYQIGKYRDQPGGITTLGVPQKYMKYLQKIKFNKTIVGQNIIFHSRTNILAYSQKLLRYV